MSTDGQHWTKRPGLFWAKTGAIGCGAHTPAPGSDTWVWEGWKKVSQQTYNQAAADGGAGLFECQTCYKSWVEANR